MKQVKELKLKNLQDNFNGIIEKKNNKYMVTFEGSTRQYGYKCNLLQLAEKLKIDINVCLSDKNVYDNNLKGGLNRFNSSYNRQNKIIELMKNNTNILEKGIMECYNNSEICEQYQCLKENTLHIYHLYMVLNLRKNDVSYKIIEENNSFNIPKTGYKEYIKICTFSNFARHMTKGFNIDKFVKNELNEWK